MVRGIGYHHAGMLPIVKEIVEILFGDGFISAIFATTTFAIGINMPARSVIFTSVKKFNGSDNVILDPSEYLQMAGRAGRRGKDPIGSCLILLDPAFYFKGIFPEADEFTGLL